MRLYRSYESDQLITREQALYEEFGSIATAQGVSAMIVRDDYMRDFNLSREIDEAVADREVL